jgi:hypothetical protein
MNRGLMTGPDYVWIHPKTGEITCWLNNLPKPWSKAGKNNGIIGSGVGPAKTIYLAVSSLSIALLAKTNPPTGHER